MARLLALTEDPALQSTLSACLPTYALTLGPEPNGLQGALAVLFDARLGAARWGALQTRLLAEGQSPAVLVLCPPELRKAAVPWLRDGAQQLLPLPPEPEELCVTLERLQSSQQLSSQHQRLWATLKATSDRLKATEIAMERKLLEIAKLSSLGQVVNPSYLLEQMLQMIVATVCDKLASERCSLILIDESGKDLVIYSHRKASGEFETQSRLCQRGRVTVEVVSRGCAMLVKDVLQEEKLQDESIFDDRVYKTRSFISAPMRVGGAIVAVIHVADRKDRAPFTPQDLAQLVQLSEWLTRLLERNMEDARQLLVRGATPRRTSIERDELSRYVQEVSKALESTRLELDQKLIELSMLHNMGKVIRATFAIEELLRMIVDTVGQSLACNRCSVLWVDSQGDILVKGVLGREKVVENLRLTHRGAVTQAILQRGEPILAQSSGPLDQMLISLEDKDYRTRSFLSVPIKIKSEVVAIINVTDKQSGADFNENDLRLLEILANQSAISIENFRLSEQLVEKERMRRELEIAHSIQVRLLPQSAPSLAGASLFAQSLPAKEVGGDYFDYFALDEKRWGIALGDVSGKGVPAALLMVMVRSLLRAYAASHLSTAQVLTEVNRAILPDIDPSMFMTLFYGIYQPDTGALYYTNAGHNYPLVMSREGFSELRTSDLPLGITDQAGYEQQSIQLLAGQSLVLFSDGITEAMDESGQMFGQDRLLGCLQKAREQSVPRVVQSVLEQTCAFAGRCPQYDDMTLLVLRAHVLGGA